MKYFLNFHPKLVDDITENYKWYLKKDIELANEFLELFYSCVQKIESNPFIYRKIKNNYRRCLVRKFPFAVYYYIQAEDVIITGLFHCAQDPETISKKLQVRRNS